MATAAVSKGRSSAYTARLAAKQRRQKIIVVVGLVAMAGVLAYEVPHTLKVLHRNPSTTAASSSTHSTSHPLQHGVPALLRAGNQGGDPFASRVLADGDSRVGAASGPDPFTASSASAPASSPATAPVVAPALPKQIVIGRPGGNRVATHGWIVILASIPTGHGRGDALRFARSASTNVGRLSILNSSHRRPLRGGYWVVYSGPYASLSEVSRRAGGVHAAGYRTAYIRELITYR